MQDNQLFEYAVIRVVPAVEREEFLNVGVVLFCAKQKFLKMKYKLDETRISNFSSKLDINEIKTYLESFERICEGSPDSGPIGTLPMAERFRWLTATRSTVVQTSKVHPGLCVDANAMLQKLFSELVLQD
jgi:hypothetical protein